MSASHHLTKNYWKQLLLDTPACAHAHTQSDKQLRNYRLKTFIQAEQKFRNFQQSISILSKFVHPNPWKNSPYIKKPNFTSLKSYMTFFFPHCNFQTIKVFKWLPSVLHLKHLFTRKESRFLNVLGSKSILFEGKQRKKNCKICKIPSKQHHPGYSVKWENPGLVSSENSNSEEGHKHMNWIKFYFTAKESSDFMVQARNFYRLFLRRERVLLLECWLL